MSRTATSVALEGFTHLIPHAAGHELIRQGRRDLTLIRLTPDVVYDQMIGMGCARKLVFSWGGNPGVGSLHRFRDAVEHGWPAPLELEEHSHAGMAAAYAAGASEPAVRRAARLRGHRPARAHAGGARSSVRSPASGSRRCARCGPTSASSTRSGRPERQRPAVGHHRRAEGDGARGGAVDRDRRGGRRRARPRAGRRDPAAWVVTAVAVAAGGAHPSYAHGYYDRDNAFYRAGTPSAATATVRGVDPRARAGGRRVNGYTSEEMMAVAAARRLRDGTAASSASACPAAPRTSRARRTRRAAC